MATAIDAKGDLVPGTGADTFARLAVGANGTVLTADSAEATGMKWATAGGGGKVLQVVMGSTSTSTRNSTSTYADTTLTATITPSASTSKVLVFAFQNGAYKSLAAINNGLMLRLVRGATSIAVFAEYGFWTNTGIFNGGGISVGYLDTPATTSATTYKTQFANVNNSAEVGVQVNGTELSTIILMEIGA
jgi:hypothetical protein